VVFGTDGQLIAALREVADAHGVTPAQIALARVIRHPAVVAMPGASSVAQRTCCFMIVARKGQILPLSGHDHGMYPLCLKLRFRHNGI
jgi:hypothetical protein